MENARSVCAGQTRLNALVVGSNEKNFTHLFDLLTRPINGQFKLDHARSLEEALPLLKLGQTDLLLCDYISGDSTTLQLIHRVRQIAPHLPVVFLSDHVNQASLEEAIEDGLAKKAEKGSFPSKE